MILMLNNRDSFVFNLARYLTVLGEDVEVVDSDRAEVSRIRQIARLTGQPNAEAIA